jgi:hypothetical protein
MASPKHGQEGFKVCLGIIDLFREKDGLSLGFTKEKKGNNVHI